MAKRKRLSLLQPQQTTSVTRLLVLFGLVLRGCDAGPPEESTCDFEGGKCPGWQYGTCSSQSCFQATQPSQMAYGPTGDHTSGKDSGWYANVIFNGTREARMERTTDAPFCLKAWYQLSGRNDPRLEIVVKDKGRNYGEVLVHRARWPRTVRWQQAVYQESRPGTFVVSITAVTSSLKEGSIVAVDDITMTGGACSHGPRDGSCRFDFGDHCGFESQTWVVYDGTNPIIPGGFRDHTTQTSIGGRVVYNKPGSESDALSLPSLPPLTHRQCLSFFYYIPLLRTSTSYSLAVTVTMPTWRSSPMSFSKYKVNVTRTIWQKTSLALVHEVWAPGQVSFSVKDTFTVNFRCHDRTEGKENFFCALDDVNLRDCTDEKEQEVSCSFDDGNLCGWTVPRTSATWEFGNLTAESGGRPPVQTAEGKVGRYIYARPELSFTTDERAALLSPPIAQHHSGVACLSFWWYVQPTLMTAVMKVGPPGKTPIALSTPDLFHTTWSLEKVNIVLSRLGPERQIQVEFTLSKYAALDDLVVSMGRCDSPASAGGIYDCDFERGMCTLDNRKGTISWVLAGPNIKSTLPRPSGDHTYSNSHGHYVYAVTSGQSAVSSARLTTEVITFDSKLPTCLEFFYSIPGPGVAALEVFVRNTGASSSELVWRANTGPRDGWTMGCIQVPSEHSVSFVARPKHNGKPGYVALDDISVYTNGSCSTVPGLLSTLVGNILDCSFNDRTFCRWKPDGAVWQFGNKNEGPLDAPGKSNTDDYIFVNGSALGKQSTASARLLSPVLSRQEGPFCARFLYHMFGGDSSRLHMTVVAKDGSSSVRPFWRSDGTTVDRWYQAKRTIFLDKTSSAVHIEVEMKQGFTGPVALANLEFVPGACGSEDESLGLCNFEHDTCDWQQQQEDGVKWERTNIPQEEVAFRQYPEALDSGAYLKLSGAKQSKKPAILKSPAWQTLPRCLEFWYRRDSVSSGTLRSAILKSSDSVTVWTLPAYPRNHWMLARVPLPVPGGPDRKVVIEGSWNSSAASTAVVALANVRVTPTACDPVVDCTFAYDLCGYVDKGPREFRWRIGTGRSSYPEYQLSVPSEKARPFAYIDATSPIKEDIAVTSLFSPIFEARKGAAVSLTYFRQGKDIASLELVQWLLSKDDLSKLLEKSLGQLKLSHGWTYFKAALLPGAEVQLEVRTSRTRGRQGVVGLLGLRLLGAGPNTSTEAPLKVPEEAVSCDFENGTFCQWTPEETSVKWTLNDIVQKAPQRPKADHTSQSYSGRFAYAAFPQRNATGIARLRSPRLSSALVERGACFSFWVVLLGGGLVTIKHSKSTVTWHQPTIRNWHQKQWFIHPTFSATEVTLGAELRSGVIAVDDLLVSPGPCPLSAKCTFEGQTQWTRENHKMNERAWELKAGFELGVKDHTYEMPDGHLLYVNTTAVEDRAHPYARVTFEEQQATDASCVTFWWKAFGVENQLNVYRFSEDMGLRDPIISLTTEETPYWWNGRSVTVSSHTKWRLVFEAVMPNFVAKNSGVLLDDLEVKSGVCPQENVCTFERDNCLLWIHGTRENTEMLKNVESVGSWRVHRAADHRDLDSDHTNANGEGHYLYYSAKEGEGSGAAYVLTDSRYRCVSFWYYLPSVKDGCLVVTEGAVLQAPTAPVWRYFQFNTFLPANGIAVLARNDTSGFAAIDDLSVLPDMCKESESLNETFSCGVGQQVLAQEKVCNFVKDCSNGADEKNCGPCTFESGTCGWLYVVTRNFDYWTRARGQPEQTDYPLDHTTKSTDGYYLLAATTKKLASRDPTEPVVRGMSSPTLRSPGHLCIMKFFYNYKSGNNSVNLQARIQVGPYDMMAWNLLLLEERPEEGTWDVASVIIGHYPGEVKVTLEATEFAPQSGYVAVDDIGFFYCERHDLSTARKACSPGEFRCPSGHCIADIYVCDYVDHCGDLSDEKNCDEHQFRCSFGDSLCDWHLDPKAPLHASWERTQPFSSLDDGPTRDHTTMTTEGRFLFLDATTRETPAQLFGPWFDPKSPCSMKFFFIVRGPATARLSVGTRGVNGTVRNVWTVTSPSTYLEGFSQMIVPLNEAQPYQVIFEGSVNGSRGSKGYVALDDIVFSRTCKALSGPTPEVPSVIPAVKLCDNGKFSCASSRECIDEAKVCDFKPDCEDGSDEARCGACKFSTDMCGWENTGYGSRYAWQRISALKTRNNRELYPTLPEEDSSGDSKGWFCSYTVADPDAPSGNSGVLRTPKLGPTGDNCRVTFYVAFREPSDLLFAVELDGVTRPLVRAREADSLRWRKLDAHVGKQPAGSRFIFVAKGRNIAIDDVQNHDCYPNSGSQMPLNCTFDEDEGCGWYQESTSSTTAWVLFEGSAADDGQLFTDHTTGEGRYMYVTSDYTYRKVAHLVSPRVESTGNDSRCFSFWYRMDGRRMGSLAVGLKFNDGSYVVLWQKGELRAPGWNAAKVNVKASTPFQIMFEAIVLRNSRAVIAIDDIVLDERSCSASVECPFEIGSCDWRLTGWNITTGGRAKAPPVDHSTSSRLGHFAILAKPRGEIVSVVHHIGSEETRCLRFWHFISGGRQETLQVLRNFVGNRRSSPGPLWVMQGDDAVQGQWSSSSVSIKGGYGLSTLAFAGTRSQDGNATVALDDVSLGLTGCSAPGSCTFEEDLCNWHNVRSGKGFTWGHTSTAARPLVGGPVTDHTTLTPEGRYIILDAVRKRRRSGTLESELLHYSPTSCLQFYYCRVGKRKGSATLSVDYVVRGEVVRNLSDSFIATSQSWTLYRREVQGLPEGYRIQITGSPGKKTKGIALDDIMVYDAGCPGGSTDLVVGTTPGQTSSATEAPQEGSRWDCDFENDLCHWNGQAWVIRSGVTAVSEGAGPTMDSSMQTSERSYAFFAPAKGSNDTSLVSPPLDPSRLSYCIEFWYFLFALVPVQLEVAVGTGDRLSTVWLQRNGAERIWRRGSTVVLGSTTKGGEAIVIRPLQKRPGVAEIAVDHMRVSNTKICTHPPGALCDFEGDGFCGYTVLAPDEVSWKRVSPQDNPAMPHRPKADHSFGTKLGHYIVLEPPNDTAAATSKLAIHGSPTSGRTCVRFWYSLGIGKRGLISIAAVPRVSGVSGALGKHLHPFEVPGWVMAEASLRSDVPYDVVITGFFSSTRGTNRVLALDDILVSNGPCPANGYCSFEDGFCGWHNVVENSTGRMWVCDRGRGQGTAPAFDRTLGTAEGFFVYLEGKDPQGSTNLLGILESEPMYAGDPLCLGFWLHVSSTSQQAGSLRVSAAPATEGRYPSAEEILFQRGRVTAGWERNMVDVNVTDISSRWMRIRFIGRTGDPNGSSIALDDVTIETGVCDRTLWYDCRDGQNSVKPSQVCDFNEDCPNGEDEKHCGQCDFDDNSCGWTDAGEELHWNWTRGNSVTNSKALPTNDHSTGNGTGGFMYVLAGRSRNEAASLRSPLGVHILKRSSRDCTLSFWYHLTNVSRAMITVLKNVTGDTGVIWRAVWNEGDTWKKGNAAVGRTHTEFSLEFVSYFNRFSGTRRAVAVDSVSLEDCSLPAASSPENCSSEHQFYCNNTKVCISRDQLCDHADDCGDGEDENVCSKYHTFCSFQLGSLCSWKPAPETNRRALAWRVTDVRFNENAVITGPTVDHTVGTGRSGNVLLLAAVIPQHLDSVADYVSPTYTAKDSKGSCRVRFFYYMHGRTVSKLTLYAQFAKQTNSSTWRQLWEAEGDKGQAWLHVSVAVEWTRPFRFVLRGKTGTDYSSNIAVDDISLTPGCVQFSRGLPDKLPPTIGKCKPSQFECKSGECVPSSQVCDFAVDCKDGSDEENCGPCNFEQGSCGWTDQSDGKVAWQRSRAEQSSWLGSDRTIGTGEGHVMMINRERDPAQMEAVLVSPNLPPSSSMCSISMWIFYREARPKGDTLRMRYVAPDRPSRVIATIRGTSGWELFTATVPKNPKGNGSFALVLRLGGSGAKRRLAVDDIKFSDCSVKSVAADCNFDDLAFGGGFCQWRNDPKADVPWTVERGITEVKGAGPTVDHTTRRGSYAFFTSTAASVAKYARLRSPSLRPTDGSCFSLWFFPYDGRTVLQVKAARVPDTAWKITALAQGDKWQHGEVFINSSSDFRLTVRASSVKGLSGSIAVDDFLLLPGPCGKHGICDFETGLCGWVTSVQGLTKGWQRRNGTTIGTGPREDHTFYDMSGHYVVAVPARQGDRALLTSPVFDDVGDRCIEFWYNIAGQQAGVLSVYQNASGAHPSKALVSLWRRSGDYLGTWRKGHASLPKRKSYTVVFEAFAATSPFTGSENYISLDDLTIKLGLCTSSISCDFESDTCGWYVDKTGSNFVWEYWRAEGSQRLGGPSVDVTTLTFRGRYMYAPLSGVQRGSKAVLNSDELDVSGSQYVCFSFWYYMHGATNSSLRLRALYGQSNRVARDLASLQSSASSWTESTQNYRLNAAYNTLTFQFVAESGADFSQGTASGIAVDEVDMQLHSCGSEGKIPPSESPLPPHPLDCDFETEDCLWVNDSQNTALAFWKRVPGDRYSNRSDNLPKFDHTTMSVYGTYVIPYSTSAPVQKAVLLTQKAVAVEDEGICIKFFYYMYGSNVEPLLFYGARSGKSRVYWKNVKSMGPQWNYGQAFVPGPRTEHLAFSSTTSTVSWVALDDISANAGACPPPLFCDFESDECGWEPAQGSRYRWRSDVVAKHLLATDHTEGDATGSAFFADFSKRGPGDEESAMAESPLYRTDEAACIRLWYWITSSQPLSLGASLDDGTVALLKLLGRDGTGRWHAVAGRLPSWLSVKRHRFFLKAEKPSSAGGVIAVDDIQVLGECPDLGSCNFEDDFCMWENEHVTNPPLSWERTSRSVDSLSPKLDHTYEAPYGTYALVRSSPYQKSKRGSRLISPDLLLCNGGCFSFWLFHSGTKLHDLSVFVRNGDEDTPQKYQTVDDAEGRWVKGQMNLNSKDVKCRIGFAPSLPFLPSAYFALDDLELSLGPCTALEEVNHPTFTCGDGNTHLTDDKICNFVPDCQDGLDEVHCGEVCNFENNSTCNWSREDHTTRWMLEEARSNTQNPKYDKTIMSGSGHFVSLKLSGVEDTADNGRMVSPFLRNVASSCRFIFWFYSTLTGDTSLVKVRTRIEHSGRETTVLVLQGSKHARWEKAEAVLGRVPHRFAVVLVGYPLKGNMTFVVDDFSFDDCAVPRTPTENCTGQTMYRCANENCVPRNALCDFSDDCGDMSDEGADPKLNCDAAFPGRCDFESGTCDWAARELIWQLRRERTHLIDANDDFRDHTTNSLYGNALALRFRFLPRGKIAAFKSPLLTASSAECSLRFYYMYSTDYRDLNYDSYNRGAGSLQVLLRTDLLGASELLWKMSRVHGQFYERAVVKLGGIKGTFQVTIEGKAGTDKRGGWLVDDVSFTDGCRKSNFSSLPAMVSTSTPTPPVSRCKKDDYACADGQCISHSLKCDFKRDCADGSDEASCATCSFDKDMCGWVEQSSGRFAWKRVQQGFGGQGPQLSRSGQGYFMSIEQTVARATSRTAVMTAGPLMSTSGSCRLEFYFFASRVFRNEDDFKVMIVENATSLRIASLTDNTGGKWSKASVQIGHRNAPWSLKFEASDHREASRVAIDDVEMKECVSTTATVGVRCDGTGVVACPGNPGQCIYTSQMCDFAKDCGDGSDEASCGSYSERCDFENGTCGWSQRAAVGGTSWQVSTSQSFSELTGDHTRGDASGHFFYLKANDVNQRAGASVVSVLFHKTTSQKCHVRFWYLTGADTDTLRIFIKLKSVQTAFRIADVPGSYNGRWVKFDAALSSPEPFQVFVHGTRDAGSEGLLAVDDISFTPECTSLRSSTPQPPKVVQPSGRCNQETEFMCEDNSCIPKDMVCDFKEDCPLGRDEKTCPSNCDFEGGDECGWRGPEDPPPRTTWGAVTALEAHYRNSEAPPVDTTVQTKEGDYLMVWISEGAGRIDGPIRLASPQFQQATPSCKVSFNFWLYLPLLRVKLIVAEEGQDSVVLFERESAVSKSKNWQSITTGVGRRRKPFRLVLEVTAPTIGGGSFLALDDFRFTECAYPKRISNETACASSEHRCADGRYCVPKDKVCDLYDDCSDGSDETNCQNMRITFESKTLGAFKQEGDWSFQHGPSHLRNYYNTGPLFDHTTFGSKGTYIEFGSEYQTYDAPSALYSPVLAAGKCRVTFHVHMFGRDVHVMSVHKRHPGGDVEDPAIWEQKGPLGDYWVRQTVEVNEQKDFQLVFMARAGNGAADTVALDDISFGSECRPSRKPGTESPSGGTDVTLPEGPVASSTSEPVPTASTCTQGQFQCNDSCIPRLLVCDGITDCSNGADEECGVRQPCPVDHFYCGDPAVDPCVPVSKLCDGQKDCSDGSDESLCGVCPASFCLNSGVCQLPRHDGPPSCKCGTSYDGNRCGHAVSALHTRQSSSGNSWVIAASILFVFFLGVAIGALWYVRKRRERDEEGQLIVDNPAYGVPMEDVSWSTATEVVPEERAETLGVENPAYDRGPENAVTDC